MAFDASSTAAEVIQGISMKGITVFVTGASSGIGSEAAKQFALAGADVWLAGRDVAKTQAVSDKIAEELGDSSHLHVIELDLSKLASVKKCIEEFSAQNIPLNILLNNAGCMAIEERTLTEDGLEMQIGTNHFGHFLLVQGLLPLLKAAATADTPARIINVSSQAHFRSPVLFSDIHFAGSEAYEGWKAYGQSKTANILHALELSKRLASDNIIAVSLHPGVIETELWRHSGHVFKFNKSIPQGAATSLYCAVHPGVETGRYYNDCALAATAPYAMDEAAAAELWAISTAVVAPFLV